MLWEPHSLLIYNQYAYRVTMGHLRDFRPPRWNRWELRSSGLSRSE